MSKQLIKVFTFEKDFLGSNIEETINNWLCSNKVKIIDIIVNPPGAFDRFLVYNVIYEIEGKE